MKKNKFIILYSLSLIISLYFVDQILEINYFLKVFFKIILIILSFLIGKRFNMSFNFLKFKSIKNYKVGLLISLFTFIIIFISFMILREFMDLTILKNEFLNKYQLDGIKFFIASFYLIFINSFIEEYFFRGFIFLNLENKKFANLFSSFIFAIYHISNFQNWFTNYFMLIIPLVGLIIGGMIFNYLSTINEDIYNSYIPHMLADLSLVIIGYFLIIH